MPSRYDEMSDLDLLKEAEKYGVKTNEGQYRQAFERADDDELLGFAEQYGVEIPEKLRESGLQVRDQKVRQKEVDKYYEAGGGVGTSSEKGLRRIEQGLRGSQASAARDRMDQEVTPILRGGGINVGMTGEGTATGFNRALGDFTKSVNRITELQENIKALPTRPEIGRTVEAVNEAYNRDGIMSAIGAGFLELASTPDPVGLYIDQMAEMAPQMATFIAGTKGVGTATQLLPRLMANPKAMTAVNLGLGGAISSIANTYGPNIAEALEMGLDYDDAEARALKQSAVQGIIDGTTSSLIPLKIGPNQIVNFPAQALIQAIGGATGEYARSKVAGEQAAPGDLFIEGALEFLGLPAEAATAYMEYRSVKRDGIHGGQEDDLSEMDVEKELEEAAQNVIEGQAKADQSLADEEEDRPELVVPTRDALEETKIRAPQISEEDRGDGSREKPRQVDEETHMETVREQINAEPTDAEKEAGNYKKGHAKYSGLDVTVENPKGSSRSGIDDSGEEWEVTMPTDYGYIKRTTGADDEQVDAYLGPNPQSGKVYLVDQVDADSREFDEHKAMLGYDSRDQAIADYDAAFSDGRGPDRRGTVIELSTDSFKDWLKNGDTKTEAGKQEIKEFPATEVEEQAAEEAPAPRETVEGVTIPETLERVTGTPILKDFDGVSDQDLSGVMADAEREYYNPDISQNRRDSLLEYMDRSVDEVISRTGDAGDAVFETQSKMLLEDIEVDLEAFPQLTPESLQGQEFNPAMSGTLTVYQNNDGRNFVVDGHQRLDLAKRDAEKPELEVSVIKESDGFTQDDAKLIADEINKESKQSLKNLQQADVTIEEGTEAKDGKRDAKPTIEDRGSKEEGAGGKGSEAQKPSDEGIGAGDRGVSTDARPDEGRAETEAPSKPDKVVADKEEQDRESETAPSEETPRAVQTPPEQETGAGREAGDVRGERGQRDRDRGSEGDGSPDDQAQVQPSRSDDVSGEGDSERLPADTAERGDDAGGARGDGEPDRASDSQRPEPQPGESRSVKVASNYRLTDADELGKGGPMTKLRQNIDAIKLLKKIESENRGATAEEQSVLAKYTGFGGIPQAFHNPNTGKYNKGYDQLGNELREMLIDEEYAAARASTINAHYTSQPIIEGIYSLAEHLGFSGGRILEPGSGVGNFMGLLPKKYRGKTKFTGVEMDSLTGRIAQKLYPDNDIRIEGFQDSEFPDNYFDMAVGNVPFADITLKYGAKKFSLHDYFFAKTLDKLKPGGVMAMITSRYTMDKGSPNFRKYINEAGGDFVGAIRLPRETFKGNAGTEVVTDIVVIRKRPDGADEAGQPWWDTKGIAMPDSQKEAMVNRYFADNPHMMIGDPSFTGSMYSDEEFTVSYKGDIGEVVRDLVQTFPKDIIEHGSATMPDMDQMLAVDDILDDRVDDGELFVSPDGKIMQSVNNVAEPIVYRKKDVTIDTKDGKRLSALIDVKRAARRVLLTQTENMDANARNDARKKLNEAYDNFTETYGPINETKITKTKTGAEIRRMPNLALFKDDPFAPFVMSIENYDEATGSARKNTIFEKDVIESHQPPSRADNANDALLYSLNEKGGVDIAYIGELIGESNAAIVMQKLKGQVYRNPATKNFETREEYLSGNVVKKLKEAKEAGAGYDDNIAALEKVQPEIIPPSGISVSLGSPWVPTEVVGDFVQHLADVVGTVKASYIPLTAEWVIDVPYQVDQSPQLNATYGTDRVKATDLIKMALNHRMPTVRDTIIVDGNKTTVVNEKETFAARDKYQKIKAEFESWIFRDADRADELVNLYNTQFNNIVNRTYDGSHMTMPSSSKAIELRKHQKDAVWRILQKGNTLLNHTVGAGKTFTMIGASMEMKRLGMAKKPMVVVPNHMLEQFSREFLMLYPNAKVLMADKNKMNKQNRKKFVGQIAAQDWDAVVITHSAFKLVPVSQQARVDYLNKQLSDYDMLISQLKGEDNRTTVKQLEKSKQSLKEKVKILLDEKGKDVGVTFEESGVDALILDEAHLFKNLRIATKMQQVSGLGSLDGNETTEDLFLKIQHINKKTPNRNIIFATATPVSNSMAELFNMQRYLQQEALDERGINHFDAWAATFGETVQSLELGPDGKTLRARNRFSRFRNIPELMKVFNEVNDLKAKKDLNLPVPNIKDGEPKTVASEASEDLEMFVDDLVMRFKKLSGRSGKGEDNALSLTTLGRKAALDMRMVGDFPDNPTSKINQSVERVSEIWKATKKDRLTQLIFSDYGVNPSESGFSVYDDIVSKLERNGIPSKEIAKISDYNTDEKKAQLFKKVRSGDIRILMGSTQKMGVGTNVQNKLVALHHLDAPWRPADIEQREGRIIRQGNQNDEVEIFRYVTKGSFDAYMWQILENKSKFIGQVMSGDTTVRVADDIGESELSYAEVKAIASGNPRVLELAKIDSEIQRLSQLKKAHMDQQFNARRQLDALPSHIERLQEKKQVISNDIKSRKDMKGDKFEATINGQKYDKRADAGKALRQQVLKWHRKAQQDLAYRAGTKGEPIGSFGGFDISIYAEYGHEPSLIISGESQYEVMLDSQASEQSHITRMENKVTSLDSLLSQTESAIEQASRQQKTFEQQMTQKFEYGENLAELDRTKKEIQDELKAYDDNKDSEPEGGDQYSVTYSDKFYGSIEEAKQRVLAAAQRINPDVKIKFVDQLFGQGQVLIRSGAADGMRREVAGSFNAADNLIKVSLNIESFNPVETGYHELWHSIKNMLPDEQKRVLSNKYPDVENGIAGEEKEAIAFARYAIQRDENGIIPSVRRIFDKVKSFFQSVGNALRGMGFTSVEQIFDKAYTGQHTGLQMPRPSKTAHSEVYEWYSAGDPYSFGPDSGTPMTTDEAIAERASRMIDESTEPYKESEKSKAFREWFGESKVVDAEGKPLAVYHGTIEDVEQFNHIRRNSRAIKGSFSFSSNPEIASSYTKPYGVPTREGQRISAKLDEVLFDYDNPKQDEIVKKLRADLEREANKSDGPQDGNVLPVYLSIQNPLIVDANGRQWYSVSDGKDINAYAREARENGHDGLIVKNVIDAGGEAASGIIADTYVVFSSTQIKSVFNRGTFDPKDSRISYSIQEINKKGSSEIALMRAWNSLKESRRIYKEAPDLDPSLDMSWYQNIRVHPRTIAKKFKEFTPIWRIAEEKFIQRDTIATDMGQLLESYYGLDANQKKRVNAVLEIGRLQGEVYGGKGMDISAHNKGDQEASLSKPGQTINLTPEESKAYRAVRHAMTYAMELMRDQVIREYDFDPNDAASPKNSDEVKAMVAEMVGDPKESERLSNLADTLEALEEAKCTGYVPFTRFGDYAVVVKKMDPDDHTRDRIVHREHFEIGGAIGQKTKKGRVEKRRRELMQKYKEEDGFEVSYAFRLNEQAALKNANIDMMSLDIMAQLSGADREFYDGFRDGLMEQIKRRGFKKHFFKAQNIPGYDTDFERAIGQYVYSIANYVSNRNAQRQYEPALRQIDPVNMNRLRKYAEDYVQYTQGVNEEFQDLRSFAFVMTLAGAPDSAIVNMTQVPVVTIPYMTQYASSKRVAKEMARAQKDALAMMRINPDTKKPEFNIKAAPLEMRKDMLLANKRGDLVPQMTFEQGGIADSRRKFLRRIKTTTAGKATSAAITIASDMYSSAERFNRITTYIAAYRLAQDKQVQAKAEQIHGHDPLWEQTHTSGSTEDRIARWIIDETHFKVGKVNRPRLMRGAGAAIFQFWTFPLNMLELQYDLLITSFKGDKVKANAARKALILNMGMLVMFAGVFGLPFADDLKDLIEGLYKKRYGLDLDLDAEMRMAIIDLFAEMGIDGAYFADFLARGLPRAANVDISQRVGMGRILPMNTTMALLGLRDKANPGEILGVSFDMVVGRSMRALEAMQLDRPWYETAGHFVPRALQNPLTAISWANHGIQSRGRTIISPDDLSNFEILLKGIGFTSAEISRSRATEWMEYRARYTARDLQTKYYSRLSNAIVAGEKDKVKGIIGEIRDHNANHDMNEWIVINQPYLRRLIGEQMVGRKKGRKIPTRFQKDLLEIRAINPNERELREKLKDLKEDEVSSIIKSGSYSDKEITTALIENDHDMLVRLLKESPSYKGKSAEAYDNVMAG